MDYLYKYINRLANSQRRLIDNIATDRDYSGAQGKLIHYLFDNRGRTVYQKEIESVFGLRAPTATELLNSLVKLDLIMRVPSKEDGRYKEILLTEKAGIYEKSVFHDVERLENALMKNLSETEATVWKEITIKILEGLETKENE